MDEAAQWTMSQSIAFLPPRNASQASSPASSMYESALSTGHGRHDTDLHDLVASSSTEVAHVDSEDGDEVFLSFGTVPVVVELTTPPVHSIDSAQTSLERLQLSVKTGFISVALQPWHLCILMQLVDVFSAYDNPALSGGKKPSPSDQSASPFMLDKDFTVSVTGFALLLLSSADTPSSLDRFFDHPSSTLYIPERCVRLLVENISAEMSLTSTTSHGNKQSVSNLFLSVGDLSIFAFGTRGKGSQHEPRLLAFPILITDPLLSMQYSSDHEHPDPSAEYPNLPVFDVLDWIAEEQQSNGAKITMWRTKPGSGKFTSTHNIKAVTVAIRQTSSPTPKQTSASVTVRVVPIHVFINASQVLNNDNVSAYTEALSSLSSRAQTTQHDDDNVGDTPPATPKERYSQNIERDRERRRLEKEVLDDLGLHHDYGIRESIPKATKSGISRKDLTKKVSQIVRLNGLRSSNNILSD